MKQAGRILFLWELIGSQKMMLKIGIGGVFGRFAFGFVSAIITSLVFVRLIKNVKDLSGLE